MIPKTWRGFAAAVSPPSIVRHRVRPNRPSIEALEDRVLPSTFLVDTTNDAGPGSLRQAILDANAHPGTDTIAFAIGDGGVQTIQPLSPLPAITDRVVIDGTTQPGFNGSPLIELDGSRAGPGADGLNIEADYCTVQGLVIHSFDDAGITLTGASLIVGSYIGTDVTGTLAMGNGDGIRIMGRFNQIGGPSPGDRNLVSGNVYEGIAVQGDDNQIEGNYIGTDATGGAALGNGQDGVAVHGVGNQIGSPDLGARNLISGNGGAGVVIFGGNKSRSHDNLVDGNLIGTDSTGTRGLGNAQGVCLCAPNAASNQVSGNLISGNREEGIDIQGDGNLVSRNTIGIDQTGSQALGNGIGVRIEDDEPWTNNVIGGVLGPNTISGNRGPGVVVAGVSNSVQGNRIGTDATGTRAVGNAGSGVVIGTDASVTSTSNNVIGGTLPGDRNIVSGNGADGIDLLQGDDNLVEGNYIGTDITGTTALGNRYEGVEIDTGSNNVIGGSTAAARNIISGNLLHGVFNDEGHTSILGNYIGTDVTGTLALGNLGGGVYTLTNGTIGGTTAGARNLISGNGRDGIFVDQGFSNSIQGNFIGTDVTGTVSLGNAGLGVLLYSNRNPSHGNTIGGTEADAGNVIAGNREGGIEIGGYGNLVQGNFIGTDSLGSGALPNLGDGLGIYGFGNTVGGTTRGAGNLISGNTLNGAYIDSAHTGRGDNVIQGNTIGTDVTGALPLGNGQDGVHLTGTPANLIGGITTGSANIIAYNGNDGVCVETGTANAIRRNIILGHDNGLGIHLLAGGNHDQESPVLLSAVSDGSTTTVEGSLSSAPLSTFTIEFFADTRCNPSGAGEGERFLGSMTVTTDAGGNAAFTFTVAISIDPGQFIAATATDPDGNTSAFSSCAEVTSSGFSPASRFRLSELNLPSDANALSASRVRHSPAHPELPMESDLLFAAPTVSDRFERDLLFNDLDQATAGRVSISTLLGTLHQRKEKSLGDDCSPFE
jgi:titin